MEIVAIMLLGAILNGLLAQSRGRGAAGWALLGAIAPLISLLVLVLMPDLKEQERASSVLAASEAREIEARRAASEADHRRQIAEIATHKSATNGTRECPFCAETIKAAAVVCRFCGRDLPATTAIASVEPRLRPAPESHASMSSSPRQYEMEYRGTPYWVHQDFTISSSVGGVVYGWRSLDEFRQWVSG